MGKTLRKILNIISWIAFIFGVMMVLWRIFGDSQSDLALITPFIIMLISGVWTINDEIKNNQTDYTVFKHQIKSSFDKIKNDMDELKKGINKLNERNDNIKSRSRRKK